MSRPIETYFPDGNGEDVASNPSPEKHFQELLDRRFSRRDLLKGGLHAAFAGFVATSGVAALTRTLAPPTRLLGAEVQPGRGQEVTGCIATPDNRTLFINLQHPGEGSEANPVLTSHWPDGGSARPRSAMVVIAKDDGEVVGT